MITVPSNEGNLVFQEDIAEYKEKKQEFTDDDNDNKDLYALFVIPLLEIIISGIIVIPRKLGFRLIRGIFNAMEHDDDSESHVSISSSNVAEENFYVSSDTSSEDKIMIIDAGVQTFFKSEEGDSHFDDENNLVNKDLPEEIIYLNIDSIEVNLQKR